MVYGQRKEIRVTQQAYDAMWIDTKNKMEYIPGFETYSSHFTTDQRRFVALVHAMIGADSFLNVWKMRRGMAWQNAFAPFCAEIVKHHYDYLVTDACRTEWTAGERVLVLCFIRSGIEDTCADARTLYATELAAVSNAMDAAVAQHCANPQHRGVTFMDAFELSPAQ